MMEKQELIALIESGHEIEFSYDDKNYSITYGILDGARVISFCEFYKESTEVHTVEELLQIERYGVSVEKMIEGLTPDDVWIF